MQLPSARAPPGPVRPGANKCLRHRPGRGILRGAPARSLLGAWAPPLVFDYPEEVLGVHYQVFFVVKLDLHPRVFAQEHHIPGADLYPVLKLADLDDLRRLRFLLRSIGQHYPTCFLLFALDHLDQSALAQWLELHIPFSFVGWLTRLKLRVGRRFIKRGGAPSPGRGILRVSRPTIMRSNARGDRKEAVEAGLKGGSLTAALS